jgi:chromosome segregation ATPase
MRRALPFILFVLALSPRAGRAEAATEARLRDALRQATAQLRAAEDERAAVTEREAALKKELEQARTQAKAAAGSRSAEREVSDLKRQLAAETAASGKLSTSLAQCQAAARDGADAARAKDEERARATSDAAALRERLTAAEAKNERMYMVGKEVIEWLSQKGVGSALAAREPFLGLKRVELENAAQDYEDKLLGQRIGQTAQRQ